MEQLKNTTDLIGLKDKNIKIQFILQLQIHIEIQDKLDYQAPDCPYCHLNMIKYNFQKAPTTPPLDIQGMPSLLKCKKHHYQGKADGRVLVTETSLIQKNYQISKLVWTKTTQLHTEKQTNSASTAPSLPFRESLNSSRLRRIFPNSLRFYLGMNSLKTKINQLSSLKILRRERLSHP